MRESFGPNGYFIIDLCVELLFFEGEFRHIAFIDFQTEENANTALDYINNNNGSYFSSTEVERCIKPSKYLHFVTICTISRHPTGYINILYLYNVMLC